uniref:Uncharacterized protein n=1 Tax=Hyaloperonospora arabidopsidis (strain Emoy2) TaxID=559515 RepID=M4BX55_HYAAE
MLLLTINNGGEGDVARESRSTRTLTANALLLTPTVRFAMCCRVSARPLPPRPVHCVQCFNAAMCLSSRPRAVASVRGFRRKSPLYTWCERTDIRSGDLRGGAPGEDDVDVRSPGRLLWWHPWTFTLSVWIDRFFTTNPKFSMFRHVERTVSSVCGKSFTIFCSRQESPTMKVKLSDAGWGDIQTWCFRPIWPKGVRTTDTVDASIWIQERALVLSLKPDDESLRGRPCQPCVSLM